MKLGRTRDTLCVALWKALGAAPSDMVDVLDRESAHLELYEALEKAQAFIANEFKVRHDSYFTLLLGASRLPTPTDDQVKDVREASEMLVAVNLALAHARGEK
jgi:hypothetical protein